MGSGRADPTPSLLPAQPLSPADRSLTLTAPRPPPRPLWLPSGTSLSPNWPAVPPGIPPCSQCCRALSSWAGGPHCRVAKVRVGMLLASSPARHPEPLAAQHTAGACQGRTGQPCVPPPPASLSPVQFPGHPPTALGGGLPSGMTCWGGLDAQRAPSRLSPLALHNHPPARGPETQLSGVDAAWGALELSARHPNPVRSCHASTAPATLVVLPQPRHWG